MILRTALRRKLSDFVFKNDLKNLEFSEDVVEDLLRVLQSCRSIVEENVVSISYPKLTSMNWRVDVTISTSELSRVLKPSILMRMVDSKGNIRTFEMTVEKFHKLRYSVARVLKEFDILEKTKILKIDK